MTIICALHDPIKKETWMGCDTLVSNTSAPSVFCRSKIIEHNGWLLGQAGDLRCLNIIQANFMEVLDKASAFDVANSIRMLLKRYDYRSGTETSPTYSNWFILANASGIWSIDSSFAHVPIELGRLWADGSGADFAFGAASAIGQVPLNLQPRKIIHHALKAAVENESTCGGKLIIKKVSS